MSINSLFLNISGRKLHHESNVFSTVIIKKPKYNSCDGSPIKLNSPITKAARKSERPTIGRLKTRTNKLFKIQKWKTKSSSICKSSNLGIKNSENQTIFLNHTQEKLKSNQNSPNDLEKSSAFSKFIFTDQSCSNSNLSTRKSSMCLNTELKFKSFNSSTESSFMCISPETQNFMISTSSAQFTFDETPRRQLSDIEKILESND